MNGTAYLSIDDEHVHAFMGTIYASSKDYFQHDDAQAVSKGNMTARSVYFLSHQISIQYSAFGMW